MDFFELFYFVATCLSFEIWESLGLQIGLSGNRYANALVWTQEDSRLISMEVPEVKRIRRRSVMTSGNWLPPLPRTLFKTSIFQVTKSWCRIITSFIFFSENDFYVYSKFMYISYIYIDQCLLVPSYAGSITKLNK